MPFCMFSSCAFQLRLPGSMISISGSASFIHSRNWLVLFDNCSIEPNASTSSAINNFEVPGLRAPLSLCMISCESIVPASAPVRSSIMNESPDPLCSPKGRSLPPLNIERASVDGRRLHPRPSRVEFLFLPVHTYRFCHTRPDS